MRHFLLYVFSFYLLSGCGGGPEEATPIESTSMTGGMKIYARGSWQCMGLKLSAGEKITIKSSGAWSGGQRDREAAGLTRLTKILLTDANGGNGLAIDATGNVVNAPSFASTIAGIPSGSYCDATLEITIPNITAAMRCSGNTPDSRLTLTVPGNPTIGHVDNNQGPLCSNKKRINSYYQGRPAVVFQANDCLPIDKNRLIGKIVAPDTTDIYSIAAFDVGKMYETNAFTVPADTTANSDICFRNNDADTGLGDNEGFLNVSVDVVK